MNGEGRLMEQNNDNNHLYTLIKHCNEFLIDEMIIEFHLILNQTILVKKIFQNNE